MAQPADYVIPGSAILTESGSPVPIDYVIPGGEIISEDATGNGAVYVWQWL